MLQSSECTAYWSLRLVGLQIAHEVQGLQHLIHLTLALLRADSPAEEVPPLPVCYLLPVALLQQGIT